MYEFNNSLIHLIDFFIINILLLFQGKEVAKGQEENVAPSNELLMGDALGDFDKKPSAAEVKAEIRNEGGDPNAGYEEKKGSVLDDDVKSGK